MSARSSHTWPRCSARPPRAATASATAVKRLTPEQLHAISAAMRLFVEDDLANGISPRASQRCDICESPRPMAGFIRYDGRLACNDCATDYEIRRAFGQVRSIGGYVLQLRSRGK